MDIPRPEAFFNVRGTMPVNAPSYVKRKADDQLYEALTHGEYCFVLTSRQVGKSSLMTRTAVRMRENKGGAAVVVLDVTSQGENLTPVQWYGGLLDQIGEQLRIEDELMDYWDGHAELGVLPRWIGAITRVALPKLGTRPLVIFVDEVDFTRSLPFKTDEFFAGIRECHNRRTVEPELNRLTFCLVGSARPSDLIRDVRTTPFNIGHRIDLTDFTLEEAMPLAKAMDGNPLAARTLLERVLYWTGGHPYLTQQLCRAVADPSITTIKQVDAVCERIFFSPRGRDNDDNLIFVRDRILKSEEDLAQLLTLYRKVLSGKPVKSEDNNPLISVMRLSGIMRLIDEKVVIRNRIYRRVFDHKWVDANMPDQERRRQRAAYRRAMIRFAVPAAIIVIVVSALAGIAMRKAREANEATGRVRLVLEQAYKSNGEFLRTTEYTGMSKATRELVVKAALDQLASLQRDQSIRRDDDVQLMVAGAYDTIGRVQLELHNLEISPPEDARVSFQKALEIRRRLLKPGGEDVEQVMLAQTLEDLGTIDSCRNAIDKTEPERTARLNSAAASFRESLTIREDEFNRHPHRQEDPSYAVSFARTLILVGDFVRDHPQEAAKFDSKSPGDYYRQAATCLDGCSSPPLRAPGDETFMDRTAQLVEVTLATAMERQGSLLVRTPATLNEGLKLLREAANKSAMRADFCKPHSQGAANQRRESLITSLDAAKKWLELAMVENTAGKRIDAKGDLKSAADYLGVALNGSNANGAGDASLKERVPVNIEVRTCMAEVHELLASIYATEPNPAEATEVGGCMGAAASWKLAMQERLVIHELNPENRSALDALSAAYVQYAHAIYRAKGLRDAAATYEQIADLYKPEQKPNLQTARAALGIGNAKRGMGSFVSARKYLLQAVKEYEALGTSDVPRRGQGKALAALALNWASESEFTTADRLYADAIPIQQELAPGHASVTDDPETLEKRLELAGSIARRTAVLGELSDPSYQSHFEEATDRLDELRAVLAAPDSGIRDARLLELLIDGYLELTKAAKNAKNWTVAHHSLATATGLIQQSPLRDLKSVVGVASDLEAMTLRAEISFNLYAQINKTHDIPADIKPDDLRRDADQQKAYEGFNFRTRTRDPDNFRLTGQFMTLVRCAGLVNEIPAPGETPTAAAERKTLAEKLLSEALQFRIFITGRYPKDIEAASSVAESFEDLAKFYKDNGNDAARERIYDETIEALKTKMLPRYDKNSVPSLGAQMAIIQLYKGCRRDADAKAMVKTAENCADAIKVEYPDACQRWQIFQAAHGLLN